VPSRLPARWGFSKGLLTGAAIEIPALAAAVWVLSRAGLGGGEMPFMRAIRLTAVFAGIAALLTAGGIGRLAAHAAVDGRRRAMWVAARAHAAASAGLLVIAVIPHGILPEAVLAIGHRPQLPDAFGHARDVGPSIWVWLAVPGAGVLVGLACGALIGAVCGGAAPVNLADVWSIARKPTDALGALLGPKDLVKLGAALRDRTTHLFEGIFEPAPKPPAEPEVPPSPTPAAPTPSQPTARDE
jgi:hypothetical protein